MNSNAVVAAKLNFRNIKPAYAITALVCLIVILQDIIMLILENTGVLSDNTDNSTVGLGNYLYLLIILSAVLIPSMNFRKMMNLGCKRAGFIRGCAVTYAVMAAAVSFAGIVLYYTYERYVSYAYNKGGVMNLLDIFGWMNNGPVAAFFQQFAFLLLLAVILHTLTSLQDKWYGWLTDLVLIAIISVFTPIMPLRQSLKWFFYQIIFHQNALWQIAACLVISAAAYALNRPIFARKAI